MLQSMFLKPRRYIVVSNYISLSTALFLMTKNENFDRNEITSLIAAAGSGMRLGGIPKAFLKHRGRTLLEHSVKYLANGSTRLLAGLPEAHVEYANTLIAGTNTQCLAGGDTKRETISILLDQCVTEYVIVHDVAVLAPPPSLLTRVLGTLSNSNVGAVVPVVSQIVRGAMATRDKTDLMTSSVDRERLVMSQSPQAYRTSLLRKALKNIKQDESGLYALVFHDGGKVKLIDSLSTQVKITYPEDLELLKQ